MKRILVTTVTLLTVTLLTGLSANAQRDVTTLDMEDIKLSGKEVIHLKTELRRQTGKRAANFHLKKVIVLAKSRGGRGVVALRHGGNESYEKLVPGVPRDFDRDRPYTFSEIEFDVSNPRQEGVWQLVLRGNIKVRSVTLIMREINDRGDRDRGRDNDRGRDRDRDRGRDRDPVVPPPQSYEVTNVHRFYHTYEGDHFLSTNQHEGYAAGYHGEGVAFQLYTATGPGRGPLFRCKQRNSIDHFLSTDSNCEGHVYEGLLGYMEINRTSSMTKQLFRCVSQGGRDHLSTTNPDECRRASYRVEAAQGWVR